ncbi:MAG: nuclear transport factor 2 family protein [Gammaproteobacteria bacterium]
MTDAVRLAHHYFDLSNQGKLADIEKLFTPSSTYSSANTGVYLGAEQIMEMQTKFFASFKTMGWVVHSFEEVKPGVVLFDFTFSGTTLDGETIHRPGREYVIVYNGKLQHVEVRNKD